MFTNIAIKSWHKQSQLIPTKVLCITTDPINTISFDRQVSDPMLVHLFLFNDFNMKKKLMNDYNDNITNNNNNKKENTMM